MELVDIDTIILPVEYGEDDEIYKEIVSTAKRKGVKLYRVSRDHTLSIGDVDIQIYKSGGSKTENERCLITRLAVDDFEVLAMADSSARTEKELVSRVELDTVDVLIVPHHGSAYSSSYELLNAVGGDTALISTGYNNYGHPAKETLERLEECGYNVYRTDEANTIEMRIG
jgi:competence protein ComEC